MSQAVATLQLPRNAAPSDAGTLAQTDRSRAHLPAVRITGLRTTFGIRSCKFGKVDPGKRLGFTAAWGGRKSVAWAAPPDARPPASVHLYPLPAP